MKIAIVGYDTEGRASYDYFAAQGHVLEIRDQNQHVIVPEGSAHLLGHDYLKDLNNFDLIVRTAGLHPRKILDLNPAVGDKITTLINEFFSVSPTRNMIGVTGTKGKGTTSSLITHMLAADGRDVHLGGNIGIPPLTFLDKLTPDSWVVLELSSFQLLDLQASPHIAVCLMMAPEHLDWHHDLTEYFNAKCQLFAHQTPNDIAIYFADNETSHQIAKTGDAKKLPYYAPPGAVIANESIAIDGKIICKTDDLKLLGRHNWQNACAAVTAAWQVTQNVEALRSALTSFTGLPHRLEFVGEAHGVRYYDDSFGTTPETAIVAIEAFPQPKVLILGGSDKGANYTALAETVIANNVRDVLVIGQQASRISEALHAAGFTNIGLGGTNMPEIVENARLLARPGDIVLLSPACASFDMFVNYKDRGEQFTEAVQSLV